MSQASLSKMPAVWDDALLKLLSNSDWQIADSAVTAILKLSPKKPSRDLIAALLKLAARTNVPAATRLHALSSLPSSHSKEGAEIPDLSQDLFTFVFARLIEPQTPPQTRLAAAEILGRSRLSTDLLLKLTTAAEAAGPLELDHILSAFAQTGADDAVAAKLLDALEKSRSLAALRADTLRTSMKHSGQPIQERVEALLARLTPDAAKNKSHLDELLARRKDGDIRRGQLIFNSTKAACSSCHTIGYVGGKVGPDLTRVGSIRTERDLLESIVFPSSSFVQSFEPMIVETTDGDVKSGILRKNDGEEVLLVTGPDQQVRISRKEIKSMRPGKLSVMPAGLDQQLTPQELTDLVTFLRACK
jgi:putative heme-binding domain-containing protein